MTTTVCPDCGQPLRVDAPAGSCPACLLRLAAPCVVVEGTTRIEASGAGARPFMDDEGPATRIGPYKLLEIIGEGGFGTVWMAEQQEPVRRKVALKIIKLGMDTRQVVARFEAERQALALMDHPNIARVLDAGATDVGRPYFVMELVRGLPITEFCDVRQLTTRERIELLIPVCQAVQHAHQKGVIHRDLKPSNILVTEQDGRAVPKVIDFGVAKAIAEPLTDKTLFTRFHQFLGTPAYMSPEQAGLGGLDVDTRADIYSLGVLLYELLTGRPPLDPRQLREAGAEVMLRTIRDSEPPKPSTRLSLLKQEDLTTVAARRREDPQRLARVVRGDLDWIVLKALEKDRGRRYETANGLAADLRRYLENEPIAARPPSTLYRFQKLARRNKLAFATAGAVAAALVIGLVATTWQAKRAKRHFEQARRNAYASEMNAAFHAWDAGRVVPARELLDRQRPHPGASLPDLRGFDWRYLWSVTRPSESFTLTNATSWGFALSNDGTSLVGLVANSGHPDLDWRLQFWNLVERRRVAEVKTGTSWIFNAAFSPDGRSFAVPRVWKGTSSHLELWDWESRSLIKELSFEADVLGVAFSPDGKTLAVSGGEMYLTTSPGEVRFWDAESGVLLRQVKLPQWGYQVAFSSDGRNLAVSCGDGTARILEVPTGEVLARLTNHNGFVAAVTFTHDGTRLVTGDERGYVRIWNWIRGYPETIFKAHNAPIYQISITADDQRLVTASRDFTARLWDRHTGKELARFAGHNGGVTSVRLLPGDQSIITASQDRDVKVWSTQPRGTDNLLSPLPGYPVPQFTSSGRYVAAVSADTNPIAFFDAATGGFRTNLSGQGLAASQDGSQLAILNQTNVLFYDPIQLTEIGRMTFSSPVGGQPSFSPDGRLLAFRQLDPDGPGGKTRAVILDVHQRRVVRELQTDFDGTDGWTPVYFARRGGLLLTTRWNTTQIGVWDTSNWQRIKMLEGPPADGKPVVALSPDGRIFAISGIGGRLHLWDLEHLAPLETINLGTGDIYSLAFDLEGQVLAVGAIDGSIRLWNLPAGREVAALRGHSSLVRSVEFSPDRRILASGSHDATIRLWRAPSWEEIKNAESGARGLPTNQGSL